MLNIFTLFNVTMSLKKNSKDPELEINKTKQIYIYNHTIEIYKRKMSYPKKKLHGYNC